MSRFVLHPCKSSTAGTFYDVVRVGNGSVVATVVIRHDRPQLIEVCHPNPINRIDGKIDPMETELLEWLSDRDAMASALAQFGAGPIGSVGWIEWVRRTI